MSLSNMPKQQIYAKTTNFFKEIRRPTKYYYKILQYIMGELRLNIYVHFGHQIFLTFEYIDEVCE